MALVLVGDCSTPLDPSKYPADMVAVCGYLGGDTPRVWNSVEIAAVRATGRWFWPIWTAPNSKSGTRIGEADGVRDGAAMLGALRARGFPLDTPVFYDVEYSTYNADPAGAQAAISAFKRTLYAGRYPNAFAYCTRSFNRDWVAWWTNIRPTFLPVGWVGQQYSGIPGLDFSVFDLERLGIDMELSDASVEKVRAAVMASIQAYIPAELGGSVNRIVQILGIESAEQADIATIKAKLTDVGQPGSSVDVHALSVELSNVLGTALSNVK